MSLTEAGELLLRHAQAIVARLEAAQADFAALAAGEAGTLRVGTYQSIGQRVLPTLMRRFRSAWPSVELRITEMNTDQELVRLVERGDLDLTFADFRLWDGPFEWLHLLDDPYVLLVQAGSPPRRVAAPRRSRRSASSRSIGFRVCRSWELLESHFRSAGPARTSSSAPTTTAPSRGWSAPASGSRSSPAHGRLQRPDDRARGAGRIVPRRIGLVWHTDRYRSPAARGLADIAREVCTGSPANRRTRSRRPDSAPSSRSSGGRSTADWSVISSRRERKRKTAAGRPPVGPGSRRSPVASSSPRRRSTRWRFVVETGWPSAAAYSSRSCEIVNVSGASANPTFVYESFARSRSRPASAISSWSNAIDGSASTGCQAVSSGTSGSRSDGTSPT